MPVLLHIPCVLCRKNFILCSHCYRGDKYCSKICSDEGYNHSRKKARKRYAKSPKGLKKGRERQNNFRRKQREKAPNNQPICQDHKISPHLKTGLDKIQNLANNEIDMNNYDNLLDEKKSHNANNAQIQAYFVGQKLLESSETDDFKKNVTDQTSQDEQVFAREIEGSPEEKPKRELSHPLVDVEDKTKFSCQLCGLQCNHVTPVLSWLIQRRAIRRTARQGDESDFKRN